VSRRIHNYFVRFSDPAQDFALNAEVSSNADVPDLHYILGVNDGYLEILARENESVIRQRQHPSQHVRWHTDRRIAASQDLVPRIIHMQLNKHGRTLSQIEAGEN
jgi:hypothetical protein